MSVDVSSEIRLSVRHVARGRIVEGDEVVHTSRDKSVTFVTPRLDIDEMLWPRTEPFPAYDVPIDEIIEFLVETGKALDLDRNVHMQEALENAAKVNVLSRAQLETAYREVPKVFDPVGMHFDVEEQLRQAHDQWRVVNTPVGGYFSVRAVPARVIHVLAGNGPVLGPTTIIRSALSRGVHLLKLPSNELFCTVATLATMADIDPKHPVTRSFSAAYWRGGDDAIESVLYRPQFFDKVVAWGGEAGIKNVQRYIGPGLELITMDPKTSISMLGRETFEEDLAAVAALATADVGNQEGCGHSRHQFVEGTIEQVDAYCEALVNQLRSEIPEGGAGRVTPAEIRDDVDALRHLEPFYRVWGGYDGRGLVVRSEEPVDFHPIARTVNVIRVDDLRDAMQFVNVATQSVGVYPRARKLTVRDALASAGVQRIFTLGYSGKVSAASNWGKPWDGMYVLNRMVKWVSDLDDDLAYEQNDNSRGQ